MGPTGDKVPAVVSLSGASLKLMEPSNTSALVAEDGEYPRGQAVITNRRLLLVSCEPALEAKFDVSGEPHKGRKAGHVDLAYETQSTVWYKPSTCSLCGRLTRVSPAASCTRLLCGRLTRAVAPHTLLIRRGTQRCGRFAELRQGMCVARRRAIVQRVTVAMCVAPHVRAVPLANFRSIEMLIRARSASHARLDKPVSCPMSWCAPWERCWFGCCCCPMICGNRYEGSAADTVVTNERCVMLAFEGVAWGERMLLKLEVSSPSPRNLTPTPTLTPSPYPSPSP
jgi:hypothetical protein